MSRSLVYRNLRLAKVMNHPVRLCLLIGDILISLDSSSNTLTTQNHHCTVSLLNGYFALTAAHCFLSNYDDDDDWIEDRDAGTLKDW